MNWQEIGTILTGTFGLIAGAVYVVKLIVRDEVSQVGVRYTPRELADARHENHEHRIELIEGKVL
jgi:hypothetical protein